MSSWRSRAGHFVGSAVRRGRLGGYETSRGACDACGDGRDGRGTPRRFRFPRQVGQLPRYVIIGGPRLCGACVVERLGRYELIARRQW